MLACHVACQDWQVSSFVRFAFNVVKAMMPKLQHSRSTAMGDSRITCGDCRTPLSSGVHTGMRNSLQWLSLQGCPLLSSSGLAWLCGFCRLSYLDLSGTHVLNLVHLSGCTSLQRLRLSGCEQLADGALHSLAGLPALADLDLRGSRHLMTATLLDDLARVPGMRLSRSVGNMCTGHSPLQYAVPPGVGSCWRAPSLLVLVQSHMCFKTAQILPLHANAAAIMPSFEHLII